MKKLLLILSLFLGVLIGGVGISQSAGTLPSTLSWANPVDITDGIQIEKAASLTGAFTIIKQTAANIVTYIDATNSPGDNSCYRIAYFNTSGVGGYAGTVCKSFPQIPAQVPATFGVN
jgi:hypothetical protein